MAWDQLIDIKAEAAEARRADEGPPSACPNDGQPLEQGPNGGLHCPYDGYRWPS